MGQFTFSACKLHGNVGRNIALSGSRAVATRSQGWNYGIVATKEPVLTGQMLKVTVLATETWKDGLVSVNSCAINTTASYYY